VTRGFEGSPPFPAGAHTALGDHRLRVNLGNATHTIRAKRDRVVAELDTWEDLRLAAEAIKSAALADLDNLLVALEERVTAAGGTVHFARNAAEANEIITALVRDTGSSDVVKVKSMTTAEIRMNQALEGAGITPYETDLAELIVQLGDDLPSHIVVPAIHLGREEIRRTFATNMGRWGRPAADDLTDDPADLAGTARLHLRERFLRTDVGISGGNFLIAETGSVVVVESEGNGRMCITLPRTLISVVGIDKVIPTWADLDVFLQVLPRSATGERMNPYNSVWTGVTPGDGPEVFHLVLVDNGRTSALADTVGRQALRCIRCAACLNVCPVYERVGGHAYGSVYPGPIGAVLTPQLDGVATDDVSASLPYASTLCGACFDACPVRIDIPRLLVHLRADVVDAARADRVPSQEQAAMRLASWILARPARLAATARLGSVAARLVGHRRLRLPGFAGHWTGGRSTPLPREASFAAWWAASRSPDPAPTPPDPAPTPPDPAPTPPDPAPTPVRLGPTRKAGQRGTPWATPSPAGRRATPSPARRPLLRALTAHRSPAVTNRGASAGSRSHPAREEILALINRALGSEREVPPVPRAYRRDLPGRPEDVVAHFAERVTDYRARVVRTTAEGLADTVARLLVEHGSSSVAVPTDLSRSWLASLDASVEVRTDHPALSLAVLDRTDSVVTACSAGVAETGTVILDSGPGQGRRALTLVPDHHVVVIRADQVVAGVHQVMDRLDPTGPQTWISGPSATSDIELRRVEGVHGPRTLDVVVVEA
jgi:L-lactate dehydrogenase complex protein LldF